MTVASYVKYTAAIEPLFEAINSGTDTWKVALSNTVNVANTTFTAGTTDLATAGGYTAGGNTTAITTATQTSGTYKLVLQARPHGRRRAQASRSAMPSSITSPT